MSAITSELARLSGPLAYLVVAALVFGETALFFGFVLPGEIAVVRPHSGRVFDGVVFTAELEHELEGSGPLG